MTVFSTKTAIDTATEKIKESSDKLEIFKKDTALSKKNLQDTADQIQEVLGSALDAVDSIVSDQNWKPTTRRFIRRLFSREAIIAIVAVISIWAGDLEAQQSVGVAVAAAGLVLGRSAVKVRNKTVDS